MHYTQPLAVIETKQIKRLNKMSEEALDLEWNELLSPSDIELPTENKYGIYIWGFNIENKFIPYYVGIADNVFLRMTEHLNSIIGGKYVIYHMNSLINFIDFKNQAINDINTGGKLYSPITPWQNGYKTFIKKRKKLQNHIDFMIDCFTFSYTTFDKSNISKKDLKEIEKICINQIGKENLQNTRSGSSNRFIINHFGEKRVIEKIKQQTANKS